MELVLLAGLDAPPLTYNVSTFGNQSRDMFAARIYCKAIVEECYQLYGRGAIFLCFLVDLLFPTRCLLRNSKSTSVLYYSLTCVCSFASHAMH